MTPRAFAVITQVCPVAFERRPDGRLDAGEEAARIVSCRLFSEAAGTIAVDGAPWSQVHAQHLRGDPHELCIPVFNGLPYAEIEMVDTPGAPCFWPPERAGDARLAGPVGDRCWPWPEVRLRIDSTRAFVHCDELAHRRECDDTSCITVWDYAIARRNTFGERTFVLTSRQRDALPGPDLTPVNEWVSTVRRMGLTARVAFEVEPDTADALRVGRAPAAAPLDASEYL